MILGAGPRMAANAALLAQLVQLHDTFTPGRLRFAEAASPLCEKRKAKVYLNTPFRSTLTCFFLPRPVRPGGEQMLNGQEGSISRQRIDVAAVCNARSRDAAYLEGFSSIPSVNYNT